MSWPVPEIQTIIPPPPCFTVEMLLPSCKYFCCYCDQTTRALIWLSRRNLSKSSGPQGSSCSASWMQAEGIKLSLITDAFWHQSLHEPPGGIYIFWIQRCSGAIIVGAAGQLLRYLISRINNPDCHSINRLLYGPSYSVYLRVQAYIYFFEHRWAQRLVAVLLLVSLEEVRLYFHPDSETVINIRSPAWE